MSKCPNCGAPMQDNTCNYCHYTEETKNSNNGGGNVVINNVYNEQPQGTNVVYVNSVSPKSKTTALLLCLFLGGLGAHRFYVGKVGSGIAYLFTYAWFGIGWLIDLISIISGSFKDSNNLPLKN